MKYQHIKPENVEESDFGSIVVQNLFANDQYEKFSIAKVKIIGTQQFGLNPESDVVYYVLDGNGEFYLEDEIVSVKKGDLVFIPKNTKYKDSGQLTLLSISAPKFDSSKRVHFKTE